MVVVEKLFVSVLMRCNGAAGLLVPSPIFPPFAIKILEVFEVKKFKALAFNENSSPYKSCDHPLIVNACAKGTHVISIAMSKMICRPVFWVFFILVFL